METLGILLIFASVTVFLSMTMIALSEAELKTFLLGLVIAIILAIFGFLSIGTAYDNAEREFKYAVEHQEYQQIRTFVNGIYKDKIVTKDETFCVTEYSKFKNVLDLKVDQVITVVYIKKEHGVNHIIDIKVE